MMKILSADQIRQTDRYTIENEPISSYDLMERAATACSEWIIYYLKNNFNKTAPRICIVCGTGNNGGDGLVIARKLIEASFRVEIYTLQLGSGTIDFQRNKELLEKVSILEIPKDEFETKQLEECEVLIDCIFGTGLSRGVKGDLAVLFRHINELNCKKISIDLPSGLFSERVTTGEVIQADIVLTFEAPKLSFFMAENTRYLKEFHVLPIGLDKGFIEKLESDYYLVTSEYVSQILKKRGSFDHKGNFGHAILVCGERGKWGATILAAQACLRSGVGKLSVYCDDESLPVIQEGVPEAMCFTDIELVKEGSFDALGVGPGLGIDERSYNKLRRIIEVWDKELVIDADAINLLSTYPDLFNSIIPQSIFTPHPGEFKRLSGSWESDFEKIEKQKSLAKESSMIILLKGKYSSIANTNGRLYFNQTGNPGMATAGSGDVLTGIITGFKAQGYGSFESAILGAWLHGLSGDLAVSNLSIESMIAGDLINHLSNAFNEIRA